MTVGTVKMIEYGNIHIIDIIRGSFSVVDSGGNITSGNLSFIIDTPENFTSVVDISENLSSVYEAFGNLSFITDTPENLTSVVDISGNLSSVLEASGNLSSVIDVPRLNLTMVDTFGTIHDVSSSNIFTILKVGWAASVLSIVFNILYYVFHPSKVFDINRLVTQ